MTRKLLTNVFDTLNWMTSGFTPEQETMYSYYNLLGEISVRIVEYRRAHSLSQAQLAERLGITQAMVSKYESGDYNFSVRSLNDVCSKLGLGLEIRMSEPEAAAAQNNPLQSFCENNENDLIAA